MKLFYIAISGLVMSVPVFSFGNNVQAQTMVPLPPAPKNCVYLKEVSTGKTQIRKTAQAGNENTDFAVPTGVRFATYKAYFTSENNANFNNELFFKYNDGSNAKVYSNKYSATRFKPVTGAFRTPTAKQPYQVNFRIGTSPNNSYQIALLACQ